LRLVGRKCPPRRSRVVGGGDGGAGVGLRGVLQDAEHVLVVVRLDDLDLRTTAHLLAAADGGGQVELLVFLLLELELERRPFGRARGVGEVRLVDRSRW
jgi:hypothetical protein